MSLDGKIATRSGQSRWISGPPSRAHAHELDLTFVSLEHWWFNEPALKTFSNHGFVPQRQAMWLAV